MTGETGGLAPAANSVEWWNGKGRKYLAHGDARDRRAEFSRLAGEVVGSVLEVGPAFGAFSKYLPEGAQYLGLELSPEMAEEARRQNPRRLFLQGDVLALAPSLAKSADTVIAGQFLEHFENPAEPLRALATIARQRLLVSVPAGPVTETARASDGHLYGWETLESFCEFLKEVGEPHAISGDGCHFCVTVVMPGAGRRGSLAPDLEKIYGGKAWFAKHASQARAGWARAMAASALALRPTIESAVDLGAGGFVLCNALAEKGVKRVVGVEHSEDALEFAGRGVLPVVHDLRKPLSMRPFDAAVCMEVAEHLDAKHEKTLLDTICGLASRWIVFSAAAPKQGGTHHVNCRLKTAWADDFNVRGWERAKTAEDEWAKAWKAAKIPEYYWRNLLVLRRKAEKKG